ncbi:MAG: terminase [Dehalococcoidia bacterium]
MTSLVAAPRRVEPVTIGPTWRRGPGGRFVLPMRTLGWEQLDWIEEYLLQPDGPAAGGTFRLTDEQKRWLLWWYALDDRGRFAYRRGVLRRLKGWGKDPFACAICSLELMGPCRFGGWRADGQPIAVQNASAWVLVAAVSKDQTRNTMTLFAPMLSEEAIDDYRVDLGKEVIYAEGGRSRLDAVTSSPRALEGPRPTMQLGNETQHWLQSNDGHEMAKVMARNAAKIRDGSSRRLHITNAHNPAEDSVAQRDWEAWQQIALGKTRARGLMYDSIEAPADTDLSDPESLAAGLRAAAGDSTWLDIERLMEEIWDPETEPSISRRFYLNQLTAAEDAWIAPHEWDMRAMSGLEVKRGALVTIGFDGSKTDDHCALVGCDVETGHLFTIGVWDPEDYGGEAPRGIIDGAVRQTFERYDVVGFYSDLHPWESYVDAWEDDFRDGLCARSTERHPIAYDMRGRQRDFTFAVEAFHEAALEGALTWDGNAVARQHVQNARRRPNQYGVTFGKEHRESSRKVDWLAAAVLARTSRQAYLSLPENKKRRKRTGNAAFF